MGFVSESRKQHDLGLPQTLLHPAGRLQAVEAWQFNAHHHNLRLKALGKLHGLLAVHRLCHYFQRRVLLQDAPQKSTEVRLLVSKQDAQARPISTRRDQAAFALHPSRDTFDGTCTPRRVQSGNHWVWRREIAHS